MPLALRLSEGLGISSRGRRARVNLRARLSGCRSALRKEQSRYPASAAPAEDFAWRCAPCRLDRSLELLATTLCGCLKCPTADDRTGLRCFDLVRLVCEQPVLTFTSARPSADWSPRSAPLQPIAAYGGFRVCLDWPALTPALTEIRLFVPFGCSTEPDNVRR